jgi:hypothetical protein
MAISLCEKQVAITAGIDVALVMFSLRPSASLPFVVDWHPCHRRVSSGGIHDRRSPEGSFRARSVVGTCKHFRLAVVRLHLRSIHVRPAVENRT